MTDHIPQEVVECKLESEKRWTAIKLDIQKVQDDIKALQEKMKRQSDMISDIQQLTTSVAMLAGSVDSTAKNIEIITKRLEVLEQKPAKKWESFTQSLINVAITILLGFIAVKIGLA